MANMATWARDWHIVRSKIDFEHVIVTDRTLTFVPAEQDGELGYTISHNGSNCDKGCFKGTFLRVQGGTTVPDLVTIAGDDVSQLQPDLSNDAVLKDIADYVSKNGDSLVRLVGAVELPKDARTPGEDKLEFYVYQISNAVENDRTLVFFQAKMDANSAANGGGSVVGYS
jgi:hypothetical protein